MTFMYTDKCDHISRTYDKTFGEFTQQDPISRPCYWEEFSEVAQNKEGQPIQVKAKVFFPGITAIKEGDILNPTYFGPYLVDTLMSKSLGGLVVQVKPLTLNDDSSFDATEVKIA